MSTNTAANLRALLDIIPVAALATLHKGNPAVSMVPFVWVATIRGLVLHVSALATHTQDMVCHPSVGLLVTAMCVPDSVPQALPRVAFRAQAHTLAANTPEHAQAETAYQERFPDSDISFALADFSLVQLTPESARLIAGFGSATSLRGKALERWLYY